MKKKQSPNKEVLAWYDAQKEDVKATCFFELYLGANHGGLYLCMDDRPGRRPTTVFKVRKDIVKWFDLKELGSKYVNVRSWAILKRLDAPNKAEGIILGHSNPILHLLKDENSKDYNHSS